MRKGLKYLLRVLLIFFGGVVLYLFAALLLSLWRTSPETVVCEARAPLYLTTNGLHLNFVLPTEEIAAETLAALAIPESAAYVSFGWGDRGFYLQTPRWQDLRIGVAAKALFWKSETAMHVDYYSSRQPSWYELPLCPEQHQVLMGYILNSFGRSADGQLLPIDYPGYGVTDRFYEAEGSYSAFLTCNNWVNIGLKQAEVPTALWSPFDYGVLFHVKRQSLDLDLLNLGGKNLILMLLRSVCLLALLFAAQSCHVGRFFIWNFADVNDYKKFPARDIAASDTPFEFTTAPDSIMQRLDTAKITVDGVAYRMPAYLGEFGKSLSFLVIRNDTILFERYFQDYQADSPPVPSFSVAKSFVSALVGFAVQEGAIQSVQEPVTNYFPELAERDPRFTELTIEHLLNMRSGLKYNENSYVNPFAPVARDYYGRKLKKYTLEKSQFAAEPDAYREYQSVNTQLLGLIVEKATGKTLPEYLEAKIWQPLGMEFPASWSYDSKAGGTTKAFCCLNGQARDFAKFGRLFLQKGRWEGEQLLDSAWVARSVQPNYSNDCYQYQWYSGSHWQTEADSLTAVSKAPAGSSVSPYRGEYAYEICGPDFMAIGILGQYIYVHPEKNLIMVRQGKDDDVAYRQLFRALAEEL